MTCENLPRDWIQRYGTLSLLKEVKHSSGYTEVHFTPDAGHARASALFVDPRARRGAGRPDRVLEG